MSNSLKLEDIAHGAVLSKEDVTAVVKALQDVGNTQLTQLLLERAGAAYSAESIQRSRSLYSTAIDGTSRIDNDGGVEVDVNGITSLGEEPGGYVLTWTWISEDEL